MVFESDLAKEILAKYNCTDIEPYSLVSNSGVTFILDNVRYDARHWRNVYGADVDYWNIMPIKGGTVNSDILDAIKNELNSISRYAI